MVDDQETRWRHTNNEIPRRMGKISRLEKFDATFFGVHFKQGHTMVRLRGAHHRHVVDVMKFQRSFRRILSAVFSLNTRMRRLLIRV
jgi:hypothetical protein